jgi:hypothetical protein
MPRSLPEAKRALVLKWQHGKTRKELLEALVEHTLLYRHSISPKEPRPPRPPVGKKVTEWFRSLSTPQRAAVFTIQDPAWISLVLKMHSAIRAFPGERGHVLALPPHHGSGGGFISDFCYKRDRGPDRQNELVTVPH